MEKNTVRADVNPVWTPNPGSQEAFLTCPVWEVLIGGTRGGGKAQPLNSHIYTPKGKVIMGDIKKGDTVLSPLSGTAKVVRIYPQGVQTIYRLHVAGNGTVDCSEDHLWGVYVNNDPYRVMTTSAILHYLSKDDDVFLLTPKPLQFPAKKFLINSLTPFSMGEHISLTSDSKDVRIPEEYLYNSAGTRLLLLQGLLSGGNSIIEEDGYKGRIAIIHTWTKELKSDIVFLIESLGGYCSDWGEEKDYSVQIHLPYLQNFLYYTEREMVFRPIHATTGKRRVNKVEYVGRQECQCIKIDCPTGLYITNNCIVTHNTDALLMDFLQHVGQGYGQEWRGILFREQHTQLVDVINKSLKWVPRIFPEAKYNNTESFWKFPDGEKIYFRYLRLTADYWRYHGSNYSIDAESFVLLSDGTQKLAKNIEVGDSVQTLQGAQVVNKIYTYSKPALTLNISDKDSQTVGQQKCGLLHPVLTPYGWQRLGIMYLSKVSRGSVFEEYFIKEISEFLQNIQQEMARAFALSCTGMHFPLVSNSCRWYSSLYQIFSQLVCLIAVNSCDDKFLEFIVQKEPSDSEWLKAVLEEHHVDFRDNPPFVQFLCDSYSLIFFLYSALETCINNLRANPPESHLGSQYNHTILTQGYSTRNDIALCIKSVRGLIQGYLRVNRDNHLYPVYGTELPIYHAPYKQYSHPYSNEPVYTNVPLNLYYARITDMDYSTDMVDFEIETDNHYLTPLRDDKTVCLINQNSWIGFEELTNWATDECYKLMISCNRSTHKGIPLKYRATCNPAGPGHCIPYGEVLTLKGWKNIKEIKKGEEVYTVTQTGYLEKVKVEQVHKYHYDGKLVCISKSKVFMLFTPEHQLPVSARHKDNILFHLKPFNELTAPFILFNDLTPIRSLCFKDIEVHPNHITTLKYKGFVYCLGIPETHTFIVRQENNFAWVSGNSWVKQRFIDVAPPMTVHVDKLTGKERVYIPSTLQENRALMESDPNYLNTIIAAAQDDPIKLRAWVYGDWNIVAGGFFSHVWDNNIHILPYFKLPESWTVIRSFDWGSKKPWSVTYIAECNGEQPDEAEALGLPYFPVGSAIVFDEIYGWDGVKVNTGDSADSAEIAQRVLTKDELIFKEHGITVEIGPADTNIYEVRDGQSIAMSMSRNGLNWVRAYKGSGSRIAGWSLMRTMLGSAKRKDPEQPHLYFGEMAKHHVRTLQLMQPDPKKPEDIDTDLEDHAMDSTRYGLTRKMVKMKRTAIRY